MKGENNQGSLVQYNNAAPALHHQNMNAPSTMLDSDVLNAAVGNRVAGLGASCKPYTISALSNTLNEKNKQVPAQSKRRTAGNGALLARREGGEGGEGGVGTSSTGAIRSAGLLGGRSSWYQYTRRRRRNHIPLRSRRWQGGNATNGISHVTVCGGSWGRCRGRSIS
jgi:hypothetical protein